MYILFENKIIYKKLKSIKLHKVEKTVENIPN